ncbi:MAG TPA: pitrilysin family protein [Candidatus Binatus sp.]|uniref:M16 family metallopeptidase n=1 Tax=Candidatus Binatus sp. TaxID=2811406 RepID=UPI002F42CABB
MRITIFGNHRRLVLVAALGTLLSLTASAVARAGISDAVKAQTLANGLRVLVLENHKAPLATFNVFYRVGSRNEQFGKTGLSHLCEHLMFKGTKKLGPEEFSQIIQQNGGEDNAFTESDFTDYFETINKNHIDVPITLEADRMGNFEPKDFDKEKHVVLEERRMRTEDNPEDALDEMVRAAAYVAHPYHWPVIGWFHDVDGLTLDDAMAYHKIYYSPQNALIVAVGDFDSDQVLKLISEAFAGVKNGPKPPPLTDLEPPQDGTRRVELKHAANLPAFEEAYHVPNIVSPDAYALEIASEILSDGQSSRLYKKLVVEKQMVVDIGAGYDMTSFDPGLFVVSAQMRPGIKAADTQVEVEKELTAMREAPVGAEELQKAKNLEQAQFVFGQDSVMREAEMLGVYEMLGDYHMVDKYLDGIDKVTAADVQRVAKTYLVATNMTEGVLVPTGVLNHGGGGLSGGELR